jgi:flagellar basal-body rod protein FlgC
MIFGAIDTASSGLTLYRTWLEAVSNNIANVDTNLNLPAGAQPFQEQLIEAQASDYSDNGGVGSGVKIAAIVKGDTEIDLGDQMSKMMMAQRGYEANLAVVDRAKDAYQQALNLGK